MLSTNRVWKTNNMGEVVYTNQIVHELQEDPLFKGGGKIERKSKRDGSSV